jgi:hypothetical protein
MVGVINPNDTQTLDKHIQAAREAKHQLAPGDAIPPEGGFTFTATLSPGATSMPSHTAVPGGQTHGLSTAGVVGISVGGAAFLIVCAALFFFVGRSKTLKEMASYHGHSSSVKPMGVAGGQPEPDHRQPVFYQSPQSPHAAYPQAFGSPLPAYASPVMSMNRMSSQM